IKAGAVGGLIYGLYIALVGNNLIAYAESFERSHVHAAGEGGHIHSVGGAVAMASELTAPISVVAGVLWGVFLGGIV
ncbi:CbtA family protein, partial [Chryseobacterium gambrini]